MKKNWHNKSKTVEYKNSMFPRIEIYKDFTYERKNAK